MKKFALITLLATITLLLCSGLTLAASPLDTLQTPAEASNWERTTSSAEVLEYCQQVAENSEGRIRLVYVGKTVKGLQIPMLIIGDPAPEGPAGVAADKAIVLVNCNIHSGEVEGKEAMLIFAREVALGQHDELLKDLVILLVPNMNPDGNDDLGKHRINTQFTPKLVGTRYDGENYNINRDMTKLDSSGANAIVSVMNEWDPVIFIDAHATNGSFMRHAITYNWGLHPNTDPDLLAYNRDEFSDLALGSKSYLRAQGKVAIPYGNFGVYYSDIVEEGWRTFEDYPRYTTNYAGLRNRLALLLEVYSYDEFSVRVDTQYECIYGTLLAVQKEKATIKKLIAQADARSLARAENGIDPAKDFVALNSDMAILTEVNGGKVDVLSYALDDEGKVIGERLLDDEGDPYAVQYGADATHTVDYWGKFVPSGIETMGAYYLIEADGKAGVDLLKRHGIEVFQLAEPVTLAADAFQWYEVATLNKRDTAYEGHLMNRISGAWKAPAAEQVFPAGTYVVSTAQVLGSLAALLLEPASVDGAISWNVFDASLAPAEGTVRANYASQPTDSKEAIAIPVFKVAAYDSISVQPAAEVKLPFTDVSEGDWFYQPVSFVYGRQLFQGASATAFNPQGTMTRGMLATVVWRLAGQPAAEGDNPFTDVEAGSYYEQAAVWAAASELAYVPGEATFAPADNATREQLAYMLYNYAKLMEYDVTANDDLAAFTDTETISEWAVDAMKWAVGAGIVGGMGEGILAPDGQTTRAQVATMLARFVEKVVK